MKTIGMVSLGCAKNRVDAEVLLGMLEDAGYRLVNDPREAECIVVNTCGFIEPAKEESIEAIFEMAEYKKKGVCKLLIVTGCLTQRYGAELRAEMPEVDAFLGVSEYTNIFAAIKRAETGERPLLTGACDGFLESRRKLTTPPYAAYVKISDGCDNRCSYCAIPLIRGSYRSRPYESIVRECRTLVAGGVTELTLIAQDTSRYGNDFPAGELLLPKLLREVHEIEGLHWLRVLYCYPDTVTEDLLDTIAALPKACKYLDLPLQHINDDLLKRMNRRGSRKLIEKLIADCRARDILVRTTFIVGFPGETDEQFQELLQFTKEARFGRMGAFAYSPEEGTAAAVMPDPIDEAIKRERLDQLMLLQQGISLETNEARLGTTCEVLIEGYEDGRYTGRSRLEAPEVDGNITITSHKRRNPGEYVQARITGADAYDLEGEA